MSNEKKLPKRRFKQFLNAPSWEQRKLGEILKVNSGKDYKHLDSGDIPVYGTGGYMLSVSEALSKVDAIGIGRKGTIDKPQYLKAPFWTVDTLFYLVSLEGYSCSFLYHLSNLIPWKKFDESTGVPSLSKSTIDSIQVNIPNDKKEQDTISILFDRINNLITLHQRKLNKLENLKKAYLEELFADGNQCKPKRRFKDFKDDWEQRKLEEVAEIVRGASPRPIADPKWFDNNSDIGWLRISDVTSQDGRIKSLEQRISKLGQEKTRVLMTPHLLLSIAATVGKPVINYVPTGVHDGFLIFMNPKFNIIYTFWWLEMFKEKWNRYGQPGSQVNLNSELVKNQGISLPSDEEQIAISCFFENIDNLITLHQRKLQKLMKLKEAYLEEMFV